MKTNTFTKSVAALLLMGITALPVLAQSNVGPEDRSINARLREQNRRINQGVASGQLTRAEATRLRERDVDIRFDNQIAHLTGGRFTPAERASLEAKLNRTSDAIYRDKHNNMAPGERNINARIRDQEKRINQGVASGQLTRVEAARLRERDVDIRFDNQIAHITGGRFTPAERARLEAKLNRTSEAIYRDKHDNQVR